MNEPQPYQPIKCFNCGKKIAEGSLPALVEIPCPRCGTLNDLGKVAVDKDKTKPFAERLQLEKKGRAVVGESDPEFEFVGKLSGGNTGFKVEIGTEDLYLKPRRI